MSGEQIANLQASALLARDWGGALRLNGSGQVVIKGRSFFGRVALWFKDRFHQSAARRENMKVLNTLERSLNNHYGVRSHDEVEALRSERDSTKLPAKIARAVARFDTRRRFSAETGKKALAHYADRALGDEKETAALFRQAGLTARDLTDLRPTVGEKFQSFTRFLANSPSLMESRQMAESDKDGFSKEMLDACLITALRNEIPGGRDAEKTEASPHFSQERMAWLDRQYQEFTALRS